MKRAGAVVLYAAAGNGRTPRTTHTERAPSIESKSALPAARREDNAKIMRRYLVMKVRKECKKRAECRVTSMGVLKLRQVKFHLS